MKTKKELQQVLVLNHGTYQVPFDTASIDVVQMARFVDWLKSAHGFNAKDTMIMYSSASRPSEAVAKEFQTLSGIKNCEGFGALDEIHAYNKEILLKVLDDSLSYQKCILVVSPEMLARISGVFVEKIVGMRNLPPRITRYLDGYLFTPSLGQFTTIGKDDWAPLIPHVATAAAAD